VALAGATVTLSAQKREAMRQAPAMAAGPADRAWTIRELIERAAMAENACCPYKRKQPHEAAVCPDRMRRLAAGDFVVAGH